MSCWPYPGMPAEGETYAKVLRTVELFDACSVFWKMLQPTPLQSLARSLDEERATGWLMRCEIHGSIFDACAPTCPSVTKVEAGTIVRLPAYQATALRNTGDAAYPTPDEWAYATKARWNAQLTAIGPGSR